GHARSAADALLSPEARTALPPATLERLQVGLATALHSVFEIIAAAAALAIIVACFFPPGRVVPRRADPSVPVPTAAGGE
ncbi:hypothetical protein NA610_23085, partial [Salmonella sp. NW387]